MGLYNEIKILLNELCDSKVKQSRVAGEKLQRLLSQPDTRRKLANEVVVPSEYKRGNGKRSKITTSGARRSAALSEIWNVIIRKSIVATRAIVEGKSKVLESDIQLPFSLIRLGDMQVTEDDSEYVVYNPSDPLLPSQQYYWTSKLDKLTIREVFEFCMEMLENEYVLQISELPLLQFLGYICSRRNYIAYFKPHGEICAVFEEVKKRFSEAIECGENYSFNDSEQIVLLESSKVFENIVRTTTHLGIGLELFVSEWVGIVSKWCAVNTSTVRIAAEIQHLLSGLSNMMQYHPEISIMPITRNGRSILTFTKKRYKTAMPSLRLAMNKYLLRHLMTGQAAGKLSGMMPGDIGDLGSASFTLKQLISFLELVLHDIENSPLNDPQSLDPSQRIRLELFARMLSCAQRIHLNLSQWENFGNDTIKLLLEKSNNSKYRNDDMTQQSRRWRRVDNAISSLTTTADDVGQSPFVRYVLGPLLSVSDVTEFREEDDRSGAKERVEVMPILLETVIDFGRSSSVEKRSDHSKKIVTSLQVIFSCTNLFPFGSCWTSNASQGWRRLQLPATVDPESATESFLVNCGSIQDLSSIVHVLADMLELSGGTTITTAVPNIQRWVLICLISLAKSTMMVQITECEQRGIKASYLQLQSIWRRIWKLLFRPDLRYLSATKVIAQGNDGELVITLLVNIIRFGCTDIQMFESLASHIPDCTRRKTNDSFAHLHQVDLWTLPLFDRVNNIRDGSPTTFALIYCVVFYAGLRDQDSFTLRDKKSTTTARQFVHKFCIQFIEKNIDNVVYRRAVCLASICVAALCDVNSVAPNFVFGLMGKYFQSSLPTLIDSNLISLEFDQSVDDVHDLSQDLNYFLWMRFFSFPTLVDVKSEVDLFLDDALHDVLRVQKLISRYEKVSKAVGSSSLAQDGSLRESSRQSYYDMIGRLQIASLQDEELTCDKQILSSKQTLSIKVFLSLALACPNDLEINEWEMIVRTVASLFACMTTRIKDVVSDQDDLATSCSDIIEIFSAMLFTYSQIEMELSSQFQEACLAVCEACKEILENHAPGVHLTNIPNARSRASPDDMLMDDESEDEQAQRRKKKQAIEVDSDDEQVEIRHGKRKARPAPSEQRTKNVSLSNGASILPTGQRLAFCAASLLLTMRPSCSECDFVARSLVGVDRFNDERSLSKHQINILGAIHAIDIICSEVPFWHQSAQMKLLQSNEEKDGSSLPTLVCHIIKCIRQIAEPYSDFFLFGFRVCARMVLLSEGDIARERLTEDEASDIINIVLGSENDCRFISRRPCYRLEQLKCATKMFIAGKSIIRSVFGKDFPRAVVLPSLVNVHGVVRRGACQAVAAVVEALTDEEHVIEAVRKRLPPILTTQQESEAKSEFKSWYLGKNTSLHDIIGDMENQVWDDAFLSVGSSCVMCMATILKHSSNDSTQQQILSDLLLLASYRPSLQVMIFQAIDQIAADHCYRNPTIYLDLHIKCLLTKWTEMGRRFSEFPLILSAPHITAFLIKHGQFQDLMSLETSKEMKELKKSGVCEFLNRNFEEVLPHVLEIVLREGQITMNNGCDSIVVNGYFREIFSLSDESCDKNSLTSLLKRNFSFIIANALENNSGNTSETILFLKNLLSEETFERQMKNSSATIILRLIERVGDLTNHVGVDTVFDVAQKLLENFGSNRSTFRDPLECIGSSTTEILVNVNFWLDKSVNRQELRQRQLSLVVIVRIIAFHVQMRKNGSMQLGFCVHLLLRIVTDEMMVTVHKTTFEALSSLVKALANSSSSMESNLTLVKDMLYVVFNAHECYQRKLVAVCSSIQGTEKKVFLRCLGVVNWRPRVSSQGDFWNWGSNDVPKVKDAYKSISFSENLASVDRELVQSICASFSLLQDIMDLGSRAGLSKETLAYFPLHSISPDVLEALFQCDFRFCAQKVFKQYVPDDLTTNNYGSKESVPALLARTRAQTSRQSNASFPFTGVENNIRNNLLSGNHTVLMTELRELESHLRDSVLDEGDRIELVRVLCNICRSDFDEDVRILASRCLGEIDVSSLASSTSLIQPGDDWIATFLSTVTLLDALKSRCIYALVTSLSSKDSQVAMTALQTIKAIQSTSSRLNLREFLTDHDTIELIESIWNCQNTSRSSPEILLTEIEIQEIMSSTSISDDTGTWCFNPHFWIECLGSDWSFHDWIRKVVSSLLVCVYGKDFKSLSASAFFKSCQRMSFVDPSFAEVLFPVIILDLLLNFNNATEDSKTKNVFLDTWIVQYNHPLRVKLSKCFEALLQHFTLNTSESISIDNRPIELLLNCLDLLRRLTQQRFESSSNHRRNSVNRGTDSSRKSSNSDTVDEKSVDDTRESGVPWQGVPFGIVLSLDGTLVAESCLRCGRFSSGIFYLEMFADVRYGGSVLPLGSVSKIPQDPLSYSCRGGDISGYGAFAITEGIIGGAAPFLAVLQQCFLKLGEPTAVKALQQEAESEVISCDTLLLESQEGSYEQLQLIENLSDSNSCSTLSMLTLSAALGRAGLRNTQIEYLQGFATETRAFSDVDQSVIKEQWYSCRLLDNQWNDSLYDMTIADGGGDCPDSASKTIAVRSSSRSWLTERSVSPGFYECMERSMSTLRAKDFASYEVNLRYARLQLIDEITVFDADSTSLWSTFEKVDKLRVLNDLDTLSSDSASFQSFMDRTRSKTEKYKIQAPCSFIKFGFSAAMHEIALRCFPYGSQSPQLLHDAQQHLIQYLKVEAFETCELGLHKECDAVIRRLHSICERVRKNMVQKCNPNDILVIQLQKAALLESKNEFTGAIRRVQNVVCLLQRNMVEDNRSRQDLLVDALLMCGGWLSKHNIENASAVQANYITPASKIAKSMYATNPSPENTERSIKSLFALSHVALRLFESVSNRVKSLSWQKTGEGLHTRRIAIGKSDELILNARKRLQSMKKKGSQEFVDAERELKELQIYRIHLEREINNTEEERELIKSSLQDHRIQAMQSIVSALCLCGVSTSEDLSKHIFRLVSLWFSSDEEHAWSESVGAIINEAVEKVPSFRFVPLYSQLLSRLTHDSMPETTCSQSLLQQLIFKMCVQHPYHCVIPLISVANGRTNNSASPFVSKGEIATSVLAKVKKGDDGFLFRVTENYERLAAAYIHLAMADTKDFHRGNTSKIPMEKVCKTSSIRLDKCLLAGRRDVSFLPCILTKPPCIRPSCDYGDGVEDPVGSERIASFESFFSVTEGGLHRPKIVTCIGTKGGRFRELVKGEDETRQDAVMEQVFTYVNSIMARQREVHTVLPNVTRISTQSDLNLLTYNIIPLSPLAGVLEWVEHAIPFGDFIADKAGKRSNDIGAHSRYYPGEWGHGQCRSHLDTAPRSEKRKAFEKICQNNSPVFRFFFVERFGHSTESWYMAKTRYTRSVAVSSVVGHILGIGDRHTSNILVHQKTGEVVHIDFGIVFEQGKLLNTPEKVPFRLTRNIIDGMGPLGTKGLFTKAAEMTLSALKSNLSALLTILSAIVADPLYKWTLQTTDDKDESKNEAKRNSNGSRGRGGTASTFEIQHGDTNRSRNEAAEHAIQKINEKLQGYEDGTSGEQQSVAGQVSFLINSARDIDNLCVMFPGWAPWV